MAVSAPSCFLLHSPLSLTATSSLRRPDIPSLDVCLSKRKTLVSRSETRTIANFIERKAESANASVSKTTFTDFYRDKTLFITGSTGFIGKVLLAKLLWTLPNVRRVYLLIRAKDTQSAKTRLQQEVLSVELFSSLRKRHTDKFLNFVAEKLVAVAGDVSVDGNLGITDDALRNEILRNVDVIINNAATTTFDERYDIALGINVKGPLHVLSFANRCRNLRILSHVSTAYVSVNASGTVSESPLQCPDSDLSHIEEEIRLADSSKGLNIRNLKELGFQRAEAFGWPDTYSFTKSMGEMVLTKMRQDIPLVILRPTIVESTFCEPFPGWIESIRTLNAIIVPYAKGKLSTFVGSADVVLDVIPVDIVVNAIVAATAEHYGENKLNIYHVGTSYEKPLLFSQFVEVMYRYFQTNPFTDREGNPVRVERMRLCDNIESFHGSLDLMQSATLTKKELKERRFLRRLGELYRPYFYFRGRFENGFLQDLHKKLSDEERKVFRLDVKDIEWMRYFNDIHIPGLLKRAVKKNV